MPHLYFYPIFDSLLLVAVVTAVLLGLLFLLPGRGEMNLGRRILLAAVRAVVIGLVALAMLRPTLVYTTIKKEPATLVILIDQSRSMGVPDASPDGKTRWQALRAALAEAAPALARIVRDFEVKAYLFDRDVHQLTVSADGKIALPDKPEGLETAIGASLADVLRQEAGKRLLGVILLSDGAQRALAPRDLPPQTAASYLKHQGDKLFTVVLGQSRGLGEAQDVAVRELLPENPVAFVKSDLLIRAQIRVDGYVNQELPVQVWFEQPSDDPRLPGKMVVVDKKTIKATADGQIIPVEFVLPTPEKPGEYKLTLEAVPQPGELVTTNNQLSTFVTVLKGGLKLLYVEGGFRVEQKFIRRSLDAAREIHVDYIRLDPRLPETRPGDFAERLQPGKYDAYIIGDVDSTAFRESDLRQLAETVSGGAGLMMLGGFHSFGPGRYSETPLAPVLPLGMDRLERQDFDGPIRDDLHYLGPLRMRPTDLGLQHFALMLAPTREENLFRWARLPPLDGANRFTRLAPNAEVLAETGDGKPLLVTHNYGTGRVLAFAGDSTWHWVMRGFGDDHRRFWRQIVLWLAKKDKAMEGNVWVKLERRRLAPTEHVGFTVGAQSPGGDPLTDAEFDVRAVMPDGSRSPMVLLRQGKQMSGALRQTQAPGDYTIEVSAKEKGKPLGIARARVTVYPQDLELDNASADSTAMESLAAMSGGQALAPEQVKELVQRLAKQTQFLDVPQETKKTFWDKWPFFLLLVFLLTVEWYLRKRWGLV